MYALTWPCCPIARIASSQFPTQQMHILTLLGCRNHELHRSKHFIHTSGAPFHSKEGTGVPVEVETGDDVREEGVGVGCFGGVEQFGETVGGGAVAAVAVGVSSCRWF